MYTKQRGSSLLSAEWKLRPSERKLELYPELKYNYQNLMKEY